MCLWYVCQALNQFTIIILYWVEGLGWYLGLWHAGTSPSLSTCTIESCFSFLLLLWKISLKNIYWSAEWCSSVRPHLQPEPEQWEMWAGPSISTLIVGVIWQPCKVNIKCYFAKEWGGITSGRFTHLSLSGPSLPCRWSWVTISLFLKS